MAKRKTRKQKDSAALRRQVEALRAELKNYQDKESGRKAQDKKRQRDNKRPETSADSASSTGSGVLTQTKAKTNYVKSDLKRTVSATAFCLVALAGYYFLLPYQLRISGFFRYGDFKSPTNWLPL